MCDSNGDGVRVEYPFKVRLFLSKSPKTFSLISGELKEDHLNLMEKLSIDFSTLQLNKYYFSRGDFHLVF